MVMDVHLSPIAARPSLRLLVRIELGSRLGRCEKNIQRGHVSMREIVFTSDSAGAATMKNVCVNKGVRTNVRRVGVYVHIENACISQWHGGLRRCLPRAWLRCQEAELTSYAPLNSMQVTHPHITHAERKERTY